MWCSGSPYAPVDRVLPTRKPDKLTFVNPETAESSENPTQRYSGHAAVPGGGGVLAVDASDAARVARRVGPERSHARRGGMAVAVSGSEPPLMSVKKSSHRQGDDGAHWARWPQR